MAEENYSKLKHVMSLNRFHYKILSLNLTLIKKNLDPNKVLIRSSEDNSSTMMRFTLNILDCLESFGLVVTVGILLGKILGSNNLARLRAYGI